MSHQSDPLLEALDFAALLADPECASAASSLAALGLMLDYADKHAAGALCGEHLAMVKQDTDAPPKKVTAATALIIGAMMKELRIEVSGLAIAMQMTPNAAGEIGFLHASDNLARAVLWWPPVVLGFDDALCRTAMRLLIPIGYALAAELSGHERKDPAVFLRRLASRVKPGGSIRKDVQWALSDDLDG